MRAHLTESRWLKAMALAIFFGAMSTAFAHPGGVDKNGCHVNRKSGERHCHARKQSAVDLSKPARAGDEGVLYGEPVRIADGDTLVVKIQGAEMAFRLSGIDAPELGQPFGREAANTFAEIVGKQQCVMKVVEADVYGRTVVHLWVGETYVNAELVRRGMAWFDAEYAQDETLYLLEEESRQQKRGLWALAVQDRVEPWVWRKERR
jgi:micrococcal nuclease